MVLTTNGHDLSANEEKKTEADLRIELAAAYNILDYLNLGEGICNHLSAMVPGTDDQFLLIAYGLGWGEVTPENLLKCRVNTDGSCEVIAGQGFADKTAAWIHSRIHALDPYNYAVVFHTHQPWATALCCLKDPTLPMAHQNCLRFYRDVAYDFEYNGLVEDLAEGDRVAAAMGGKRLLFHRNHGVILGVKNVARAVDDVYYLERACEVIVKARSMESEINIVSDKASQAFMDDFQENGMVYSEGFFEMMKRKLCAINPDKEYWLNSHVLKHSK